MEPFIARHVVHQFSQTNLAARERVFPLLCPVREAEWVPGWRYRLIYSESGVAEVGCVFTTPNPDGSETVWQVTGYEPDNFAIKFAWVYPGMVAAQIEIRLNVAGEQRTRAHIQYTYTALSAAGNSEVERYDEAWFREKMLAWESAINQYLQTGRLANASVRE
jgi:hypothetical protein